jgi:DNA-binding CsgD family transcriptional regulator
LVADINPLKGVILMSNVPASQVPASTTTKAARTIVPFKYLVTHDENLKKQFLEFCSCHGVDETAEKFSISPATVYSVLRALNAYVSTVRPVYDTSPEKLAKAAELLRAGRRATSVAKELNLSTNTVYKVASDNNITLQKGIEAAPISQETLNKVIADLRGGKSAKAVSRDSGIAYVKVLAMAEANNITLDRKAKGIRGMIIPPQS